MNNGDLPYKVEYAKSNRSSCRYCRKQIEKGIVRLGVLLQSARFDGKITHWYHEVCFFRSQRPTEPGDIQDFDLLRWEDQQRIKEEIESCGKILPRGERKAKNVPLINKDFFIQYAKTTSAPCKGCNVKIKKGEIRIRKMDFESEKAKRYGPTAKWFDLNCFANLRSELGYFDCGTNLLGYNKLKENDRTIVKEKIMAIEKKRKGEEILGIGTKRQRMDIDDALKRQNELIFSFRDLLDENLNFRELKALLLHNGYSDLVSKSEVLFVLADLMTFGVPEKCKICGNGNLLFKAGVGYVCNGNVTEWTKCVNIEDTPKRSPFSVPSKMQKKYEFLENYEFKQNGNRIIIKRIQCEDDVESSSKRLDDPAPLNDLSFVLVGKKFSGGKRALKEKIKSLGGEITSVISSKVAAIVVPTSDTINNEKDIEITRSKHYEVDCVTEDFFEGVDLHGNVIEALKEKNIAPWGISIAERRQILKNLESNYKLKLKAEEAKFETFPNSSLYDVEKYRVFEKNERLYKATLTRIDLIEKVNSFYNLLLLEEKAPFLYDRYIVLRKWGRLGTTKFDMCIDGFSKIDLALAKFNCIYEEKTGNKFLEKYKKIPGLWVPVDDDSQKFASCVKRMSIEDSRSELPVPIKEFLYFIFDVMSMERVMNEYKIDMKKFPLGKLSKETIEAARKTLNEALEWTERKESKDQMNSVPRHKKRSRPNSKSCKNLKNQLHDITTRFYTLVPHNFGMKNPPLLDNEGLIKSKLELIEDLSDIELAYCLLCKEKESMDPFDYYYKYLNAEIEVLNKSCKEYDFITQYFNNFTEYEQFSLEIEEIFKIEREEDKERFKKYEKLKRKLLWHGSKSTNFFGIISQGLKIPWHRRGIFFADVSAKSVGYSRVTNTNPVGLMLLSEVALGDSYEVMDGNYVATLPDGKNSVKSVGKYEPDPLGSLRTEEGVEIPLGPIKEISSKSSYYRYNEYIVYDEHQILMKYLLKFKMIPKADNTLKQ